jgi:hypothetical protein
MSDIFTAVAPLSACLLLLLPRKEIGHILFLSLLFVFSLQSHLSHLPLVAVVLCLVALFLLLFRKGYLKLKWKRLGILFSLGLFSILSIATTNYFLQAGFNLSRSSNIFLAARLIESGVANNYLKENCCANCPKKEYQSLCAYTDEFNQWPTTGHFLFSDSSPLYQGDCKEKGWNNCWLEKNETYGVLVSDILRSSKHRKQLLPIIVDDVLLQLHYFHLAGYNIFPQVNDVIDLFYPNDATHYYGSKQYDSYYRFLTLNKVIQLFFYCNLISLVLLTLRFWKKIPADLKLFIFICCASLLINAILTSTLSNVVPRYQSRLAFLLPLANIALIYNLRTNLFKKSRYWFAN